MENKDITIILPLHKFDKDVHSLLVNAIESIPEGMNIIIAAAESVQKSLTKALKSITNISYVYSSDDTSFQNLINIGVNEVETKYFSILEYDDTYTPIWADNVKKYLEYNPELSILMCLEDLVDYNETKFIGNGNEAAWASSFSNEIGYLDLDCLQNFFDFYLTGSVFNTEDWRKNGGLKPLIKVTFWYEYLLRATSNGNKVFVMPKVGYNHYLGREDSLINEYRKTIGEKEQDFWFDLAKKDYHFTTQKDAEYYTFKEVTENITEEV